MALNRFQFGVGFVLDATDRATQTFGRIATGFRAMARGIADQARKLRGTVGALAIGAPLLLAGQQALGGLGAISAAAGRFEQGLAAVGAIANATADELQQLSAAAIDAGIRTQFSPDEALLGLRAFSQAGYSAEQSMRALLPTLDLAAGSFGELTVESAAGLASQAMKTFGIAADDAAPAVDKLLKTVNLFSISAGELPLALGTASRGAQLLNQSLDETLIAMGLVKNIIPSVERSSTAVAVSMQRMASPKVQRALRGIGVEVVGADKKFRDYLDVMNDLAKRTSRMTEVQSAAFLEQTFGAEALGGLQAIITQLTNGIRDNTGATRRGADAIAYYRQQTDRATGTSERFRDALLATFEGQKTLLRGTLQTMAVVFGRPFAKMLAPLVGGLVDALNAVIRVWQRLPEPVQKGLLAFAGIAAAVATLVGGVLVLKGVLGALGLTFGGILATVGQVLVALPLIGVVVGGLGIAAYAAYKAFRKNTGGIATSWADLARQLKLGFEGVVAIFRGEGFSQTLIDELNRAENVGVLRFLDRVRLFRERLVRFWEGLKAGFERGVSALAESSAMKRLSATFQAVFGVFTGAEARNTPDVLRRWGHSGEEAGLRLASLGEVALEALNTVVDLGRAFATAMAGITAADIKAGIEGLVGVFRTFHDVLSGIGSVLGFLKDVFNAIYRVIRLVGAAMGEFFGAVVSNLDFIRGARAKRALPMHEHFQATLEEARGLAGAFGVQPLGIGQTPQQIAQQVGADAQTIREEQLRFARRGAVSLLERRKREGGDVSQMVAVLRHIDEQLAAANRRREKLKITLDAADLSAVLREADDREAARATDELAVASAF